MAGSAKVVEESSNTVRWILGAVSPKGKWGKKDKIRNSAFIKNQANYQASYFGDKYVRLMLLIFGDKYVRLILVRSDFKWLWWVLPRCARDLRDSPLGDAMP